ncbi:alkaline phosphatase, partial [Xanthomonas oryzae pv. oryzae]
MPAIDPSAASPLPDSVARLAPPDPSRRRILLAGASLAAAGLLSPFARASGTADPF